METIHQRIIITVVLVLCLFVSSGAGLCNSANQSNASDNLYVEIENSIVQIPDIRADNPFLFHGTHSFLHSFVNDDVTWNVIFHSGGTHIDNSGYRHNNTQNFFFVEIFKNNEFIEKLIVRNMGSDDRRLEPREIKAQGRLVKIKMIPMHGDYHKLFLYVQKTVL